MKLVEHDMYLDGGTIYFKTTDPEMYIEFDYSIDTKTLGGMRINHKYNLIEGEERTKIETELAKAIIDFVPDGKTWLFETEESKQNIIAYCKEDLKIIFYD